jgi:hypothetical protein
MCCTVQYCTVLYVSGLRKVYVQNVTKWPTWTWNNSVALGLPCHIVSFDSVGRLSSNYNRDILLSSQFEVGLEKSKKHFESIHCRIFYLLPHGRVDTNNDGQISYEFPSFRIGFSSPGRRHHKHVQWSRKTATGVRTDYINRLSSPVDVQQNGGMAGEWKRRDASDLFLRVLKPCYR